MEALILVHLYHLSRYLNPSIITHHMVMLSPQSSQAESISVTSPSVITTLYTGAQLIKINRSLVAGCACPTSLSLVSSGAIYIYRLRCLFLSFSYTFAHLKCRFLYSILIAKIGILNERKCKDEQCNPLEINVGDTLRELTNERGAAGRSFVTAGPSAYSHTMVSRRRRRVTLHQRL